MKIHVSVNTAEVSKALLFTFRDQAPFAASLALNNTAKGIQAEQREGMRKRFTIRRAYVLQGVKISKFSTKRDLSAHIEIDPSRQFLNIFEEGGDKEPRGTRLAIPANPSTTRFAVRAGAGRTKTGVLKRDQRPRALGFKFHGRGQKAEVFRGKRRTVMIRKPGGKGAIFQRLGRKRKKRRKRGEAQPLGKFRLLFSFSPDADIKPRLDFEITARTVLKENYARNFEFAFDKAVRTSR